MKPDAAADLAPVHRIADERGEWPPITCLLLDLDASGH